MNHVPATGERVLIPKGTVVRTTHPSRDCYTLSRNQVVVVDHTFGVSWVEGDLTVRWPGTGGYWCETKEWKRILTQEEKDEMAAIAIDLVQVWKDTL